MNDRDEGLLSGKGKRITIKHFHIEKYTQK